MSLIPIDVDDRKQREAIREFVTGLLVNRLGKLRIADEITFSMSRHSDHIAVEWEGHVEAAIARGVAPDLIRARLYKNHAEVDMRVSGLRINYGP